MTYFIIQSLHQMYWISLFEVYNILNGSYFKKDPLNDRTYILIDITTEICFSAMFDENI